MEWETSMATKCEFKTWEECEHKIRSIEERYKSRLPGVWFRGQPNAAWELLSTLERRAPTTRILDYYSIIRNVAPEIEALTGTLLEIPDHNKERELDEYDNLMALLMLGYRSMAHLRHHGFPSPLLDWTASPYVAAYFAFASADVQVEQVAIFVFVERPKGYKMRGSDEPQITALGPLVRTHERHFRQQSRYTVCTKFELEKGWNFVSHETAFTSDDSANQDFLWKLTLPAKERVRVLSLLDRYNLNGYSLFGSEERLMETLAFREFDCCHSVSPPVAVRK
jgi:hypothetical protein